MVQKILNILDQVVTIGEQSLWALLWASTAICLISLAFAAIEQRIRSRGNGQGAAIYGGEGRALGLTLMFFGAGGVLLCLIVWGALFGDVSRVFRLLVQRLRDVTDGGQLAVLSITMLSMLIFNIGTYKYLGSETSTSASSS